MLLRCSGIIYDSSKYYLLWPYFNVINAFILWWVKKLPFCAKHYPTVKIRVKCKTAQWVCKSRKVLAYLLTTTTGFTTIRFDMWCFISQCKLPTSSLSPRFYFLIFIIIIIIPFSSYVITAPHVQPTVRPFLFHFHQLNSSLFLCYHYFYIFFIFMSLFRLHPRTRSKLIVINTSILKDMHLQWHLEFYQSKRMRKPDVNTVALGYKWRKGFNHKAWRFSTYLILSKGSKTKVDDGGWSEAFR